MTARGILLAVGVLAGLGALAAPAAARPAGVVRAVPCPNGRPVGPHVACTGPVTHRSGGGGGVLTIVLSVVVGLAVAGVAAVFVQRRLRLDAARPLPAPRPKRPS
ncbi:MAG TPA: hypothetical protein VGU73_07825 [Acidimicrobiia bacterium]|nr:hypothetical protein [Acidimicrobiia bacterium]